jgi:hypothetical protein
MRAKSVCGRFVKLTSSSSKYSRPNHYALSLVYKLLDESCTVNIILHAYADYSGLVYTVYKNTLYG